MRTQEKSQVSTYLLGRLTISRMIISVWIGYHVGVGRAGHDDCII